MMKKFFATLLCLALVAGLFAACSGSKDDNAKADSKKVALPCCLRTAPLPICVPGSSLS